MDESAWEHYAAYGGIAFVVLNVIGAFAPGAPPSMDDHPLEVVQYFHDHAGALKAAQVLAGIGIIGLFWWFGSLWRRMTRAEAERPRLAVVAAIGLTVGATFALANGAVTSTTAMRANELSPETTKFLLGFSVVLLGTAGFGIVVFLGAVCALSYETHMFPNWVTIIGWIAAAGFVVSTFSTASESDAFGVFGLLAFLIWCAWIIATSVLMLRAPAAPTAA